MSASYIPSAGFAPRIATTSPERAEISSKRHPLEIGAIEYVDQLDQTYTYLGILPLLNSDQRSKRVEQMTQDYVALRRANPDSEILPTLPINLSGTSLNLMEMLVKVNDYTSGSLDLRHMAEFWSKYPTGETDKRRTDGKSEPEPLQISGIVINKPLVIPASKGGPMAGKTDYSSVKAVKATNSTHEGEIVHSKGRVIANILDVILANTVLRQFEKDTQLIGSSGESAVFPQLRHRDWAGSKYIGSLRVNKLGQIQPSYYWVYDRDPKKGFIELKTPSSF